MIDERWYYLYKNITKFFSKKCLTLPDISGIIKTVKRGTGVQKKKTNFGGYKNEVHS